MPYLSVLLPARNAESTIDTAVRSTLRHLPRDAELVVLDDGSTDSTFARLSAVHDRRLRVLRGQGSGSLGAALNHLLAHSDSELVARMDADDITLPGRFRSSYRAIRQGADITFTSALTTKGLPRFRPSAPMPITANAFPFHLLLSNPVRHPAMTARRAALDKLGGYRARPSEDYDLWLRAAVSGSAMTKTPTYGLAYRVHQGQITSGEDWQRRSRSDSEIQRVFGDLSEELLGRKFPRLVTLETRPAAEAAAVAESFAENFLRSVSTLPSGQRVFLRAKLRHRMAQLRTSGGSKVGEVAE